MARKPRKSKTTETLVHEVNPEVIKQNAANLAAGLPPISNDLIHPATVDEDSLGPLYPKMSDLVEAVKSDTPIPTDTAAVSQIEKVDDVELARETIKSARAIVEANPFWEANASAEKDDTPNVAEEETVVQIDPDSLYIGTVVSNPQPIYTEHLDTHFDALRVYFEGEIESISRENTLQWAVLTVLCALVVGLLAHVI